jgi:hypothetical protein
LRLLVILLAACTLRLFVVVIRSALTHNVHSASVASVMPSEALVASGAADGGLTLAKEGSALYHNL